ncbi:transmembrane protein -like [Brachionus plicatilis]|uniref:Transmembrane protein-like n=1 Tax=Brachionus plicatilis TaxID=10195 RepID=A0A3M7RAX7_BRAPC|nr:transmembrane protein -like [Brachionus plicatilis]
MTEFEIFLHLCSISAFTVLLCLKLDSIYDLDWFNVFLPLFVVDLLQANFCFILLIRQFLLVLDTVKTNWSITRTAVKKQANFLAVGFLAGTNNPKLPTTNNNN